MGLTEKEVAAAQKRNSYWRGQVLPRRRLLFGRHLWVPVILGSALVLLCALTTTIQVAISDVASFGMTYATLGLTACVTGVVLAIGIHSGDRMRRWNSKGSDLTSFSAYSDLVFALTWAGMSQVMILLVCMASLVIGGGESLLPDSPKQSHVILLAVAVAAFSYAVNQLLVLLYTFSQVGNIIEIDDWASRTPPNELAEQKAHSNPVRTEISFLKRVRVAVISRLEK